MRNLAILTASSLFLFLAGCGSKEEVCDNNTDDDGDGAESFASFLAAYADWRIERHDGYVKITSPKNGARRIEIFANVPGRAMQMKTAPSVIVHRGHDHHRRDAGPARCRRAARVSGQLPWNAE
mgnify:CR=1 FL=1